MMIGLAEYFVQLYDMEEHGLYYCLF